MKQFFLVVLLSYNFLLSAQIGIGTPSPDAKLDIRAGNQASPSSIDGILIPRIDNFPTNNPTASQNGMLIFLTTAKVGFPIGFYYWDNLHTFWKKVDAGNVEYWKTSGNSGTTNGTDFLGTLDEVDIDFRTNNTIHTRITKKGQIEVLNTGQSVFLGEGAGENDNISAHQNVHIGYDAGDNCSTCQHNTSIGYATSSQTFSDNNTANGYQSLFTNPNSHHNNNTTLGFQSIYDNKGAYNTAIGKQVLYNAFGGYNTCIGQRGDYLNQLNDFSIFLGYIFTSNIESSYRRNRVIIGNAIEDDLSNIFLRDNRLNIGNIIFANKIQDPGTNHFWGNVGISVRDPQTKLSVDGAIKIGTTSNTNAGTIRWTGSDFEGYNGTKWLSLTKNNQLWNMGNDPTQNQILTSSDGLPGDHFGFSVSISGEYAIIGAYGDEISGNNNQGSAYIFKKDTYTWVEEAKITATDGALGDVFGYSVAISGDYAIVGAYLDDASVSNQGAAYIFKRSGTSWNQEAKITPSDWGANDRFGYSVSISGDYVIVGAYLDNISGNSNQGSAYIFKRSGISWSQEAKIIASDGLADDFFGNSVSISGDYAIIGAYRDDIGGNSNQGSAYIFKRSGITWNQEAKLTASDGAENNKFGYSVAIYDAYAIIGSPDDTIESINKQGSSYIYHRTGSIWSQEKKTIASDGKSRDNFGISVSIYNTNSVIGAHNAEINNHTSQGAAYVFSKTDTLWGEKIKLTASDGATDDNFGNAVSIYNNYIIIGAPGAEKAYFFNK